MHDAGSVSIWIDAAKRGDQVAVGHLWDRYFAPLVKVVRQHLDRATAGLEEDVALETLYAFFNGANNQKFESVLSRTDLWALLLVMAKRKARDFRVSAHALKRPPLVGALESVAEPAARTEEHDVSEYLQQFLETLPTEPPLRTTLILWLDNLGTAEIASRLGRDRRSVQRWLKEIRKQLQRGIP